MPRPILRATAALGLVGLWMAFLFAGWALGGVTHLLLLAAAVLFPWRAAAPPDKTRATPPPHTAAPHPSAAASGTEVGTAGRRPGV